MSCGHHRTLHWNPCGYRRNSSHLPCQVGSRWDGLVSHVKDFGIHVILGDGRAGLGHEGPLSACDACDVWEVYNNLKTIQQGNVIVKWLFFFFFRLVGVYMWLCMYASMVARDQIRENWTWRLTRAVVQARQCIHSKHFQALQISTFHLEMPCWKSRDQV